MEERSSVVPVLKFFNFYANENSKGIGEVNLELNEDCKFLTTLPFAMTKKIFINNLTDDSMIVGMICGSLFKIKTFDYGPDLVLNLSAVPSHTSYERDVYLYPHNAYWASNMTNFTLRAVVTNQTQDMPALYYSLLVGLALALILVVSKMRSEKVKEDGDKKN